MDDLLADIKAGNVARLKSKQPQIPFGDGQGLVKFCANAACPCGPAVIDDVPGGALLCSACGATSTPASNATPPGQNAAAGHNTNAKMGGDKGMRNPVYAHANAAVPGGTRLEI